MQIVYERQAVKYIEGLDKPMKRRIKLAIEGLPLGDVKKLQGSVNDYRLRVGNFRVLFSVQCDIIIVKAVLPRG